MAYAGQVIENPVSGERITFNKTAADTNGELLAITLELSPDGAVPVFTCTRARRSGSRSCLFQNIGDEPVVANVEVRPAGRMEELFETTVELAEEGRTNKKGMPKPLDFAIFTKEFRNEVVGAFPPVWVQRATLAPLVAIAELRGHGDRYQPLRPRYA